VLVVISTIIVCGCSFVPDFAPTHTDTEVYTLQLDLLKRTFESASGRADEAESDFESVDLGDDPELSDLSESTAREYRNSSPSSDGRKIKCRTKLTFSTFSNILFSDICIYHDV
jgi:hypothetical protein